MDSVNKGLKNKQGEFKYINKHLLITDKSYQRDLIVSKAQEIAKSFNWIGFGVLIVSIRDGSFYVIDGQHRVSAAMRRQDINDLPCLIFENDNAVSEASGFLDTNSNRKPLSMAARHRAKMLTKDPMTILVTDILSASGIRYSKSGAVGTTNTMAICMDMAKNNVDRFSRAFAFSAKLSNNSKIAVSAVLIRAFYYFDANLENGLFDERFKNAALRVGADILLSAAKKAAAIDGKSSGPVHASGMLREINKGLRNKFILKG